MPQEPSVAQQAPVVAPGVKSISSSGRWLAMAFSRLSKRLTTRVPTSLPITIQPKLPAGVSSQDWTSAAMPAEDQLK
jgi:hypothetical protein